MAKEVIEKLEEQLNCSICLDTYTNPKLLQCFHVYCQGCLVRLVVRDLQGQDSITCPICRQVTPIDPTKGARGLQPAFHINRLLEIQDSVKKIQDLPPGKQEEVVGDSSAAEAPLVSPVKYCFEHVEEELKLYCNTCKDLICFECAIKGGKHHDHDYESIKNAFEVHQREMTSSLKPLEDQLAAINKALVQLDEVCSEISNQRVIVEADIHSKVRKLHEILDVRKTELIQELHHSTQAKLKSLAAQRDQIETLQARLDSCLEFIKESLATDNQGDVLLMKSSMVKQVNDLSTTFQPDMLKPTARTEVSFSLFTDVTTMCKTYGKLIGSGSDLEVGLKRGADMKKVLKYPIAPVSEKLAEIGASSSEVAKNLDQQQGGSSKMAVPDRRMSEELPENDSNFVENYMFFRHQREHQKRVSNLQTDNAIGRPISWEEDAISERHIWQPADSRESCYIWNTEFCQQMKLFHPKRQKLRCSACKVLVHDTCVKQLYYEGCLCKATFREIKQKLKECNIKHHFLNRRKLDGKCRKCDKTFGNWNILNVRDVVGLSCSWCGDAYHVACFDQTLRQQPCHMGPLRNLILPPSRIVKVPPSPQIPAAAESETRDVVPGHGSRRKSRRERRGKNDTPASKYFTIKPLAGRQHKPLLVFVNPKSGKNQGERLIQTFQGLLNPRQVFDLSQGGPEFGLKLFGGVSNIRILCCGGDGTAAWIHSTLDKLDIRPIPPMAILPLGIGNDLSRLFGWGAAYSDEPIDKLLPHVEEGPVEELDRWQVNVWENPRAGDASGGRDTDAVDDLPLHAFNNYFCIGVHAHKLLQFHLEREESPEKFGSRFKKLSGKPMKNLADHIILLADGEDLTEKIRMLRLETICFLNIPSYGGTNPWGTSLPAQVMNDGKIETVGFFASTFPKLGGTGERIAQSEHIKLIMQKTCPVQIDGNPCMLNPSIIEMGLKNKTFMIRKVPRQSLQAPPQWTHPTDRIKLSLSKVTSDQYDRLHSDLTEIRKIAKPVGQIIATPQDSLATVRRQVEKFTFDTDENSLSKKWRFLDVATSGRVDRMFQVTPDMEKTMLVGDMSSDGLMVVEFTDEIQSHPKNTSIEATTSDAVELLLPCSNKDDIVDDVTMPNKETLQQGFLNAVKSGNLKKVKDLHGKGANLMEADHNGWTPLIHAARLDRKDMVQYIVNHIPRYGLDIIEDEKLQTALHKAAFYGHLEVCKILIENGASLNRRDYQANNVYDKAVQSSNKELQLYIKAKLEAATLYTEDEIPI